MVYTVRDDADVFEDNLRYHRAQGVDFFVVGPRGSADDETADTLKRHERAGLVRLAGGDEEEITRVAFDMGADWVIHNGPEDFWWPGNLKEALSAIDDAYG